MYPLSPFAPRQAFTALLSVFMGYAYICISSLVKIVNCPGGPVVCSHRIGVEIKNASHPVKKMCQQG